MCHKLVNHSARMDSRILEEREKHDFELLIYKAGEVSPKKAGWAQTSDQQPLIVGNMP